MNKKLEESLDKVELTYKELVEIAEDSLSNILVPINALVKQISESINSLSIDQIRTYILQLQLKAFEISEIKEKATLKAELSESIQKEQFAINFNGLDGSAAVKEKLALVETSAEIVAENLYTLMANLLKTKLDQLHRLVAALTSVLMSRMSEQKFINVGVSSEIQPTTNGRQILNENF